MADGVIENAADAARWVRGDLFGLNIPADIDALAEGGSEFLTMVFRASGALLEDERVHRITRCEACFGGGTGSKALLGIEYQVDNKYQGDVEYGHAVGQRTPRHDLPTQLFVKFSRNFHDAIRDRSKHMMVSEVKFAALSRTPGFPIAVPQCLFADVNAQSGSGLIITERIAFGANGIEPQYLKCMDWSMQSEGAAPAPLKHYKAIIKMLAKLSGSHKGGRLDPAFDTQFVFDKEAALNVDPMRYTGEKLQRRITRVVEFIDKYPQLFPNNLATFEFHTRFLRDVPWLIEKERAIKQLLHSNPDLIALCHWNANIDNAWFWHDAHGELQCGLMDWGRVGQMSVAQTIYGAFSGAEKPLWDLHLDDIVELFIVEYARSGGPQLQFEELKTHVLLVTAMMGLAYLMDAPAIIERQIPDLENAASAHDERFKNNEDARVQLHMLTMFLNQWQTRDFGALVDRVVA